MMSLREEFENNPRPLVVLVAYNLGTDKGEGFRFGGKDAAKRAIGFRDKTEDSDEGPVFTLILNRAAEVEYEDMILAELDLEAFKVDGELDDDVDTELLGEG